MKKKMSILVMLLITTLFVVSPTFAGIGVNTNVNTNTNTNTNTNANNNTNVNSNIQGQNQNQGQAQSQMQGQLQGQMQGQVGIVNDGDQIVTVEKPNTQIPMLPNANINPYNGAVKDATKDFAKYNLAGVTFANENVVITGVVDIDKFKGVGMLNTWEARRHILKKVKKLEKKYGKICVIVTTRDGSHQYGFMPSSAGSANPTNSTGAMAGGAVGWSMNLATQMAVIEFCTCK